MNKVLIVLMFILLGTSLIVLSNMGKDVQNSFIIEYQNNKNLALPDLTGKTEIVDGVYRLSTDYGLTLDYNIYNGKYILNGTSTQLQGAIFVINITKSDTYTLSFNYVSGSMNISDTGLVVNMSPPYIPETYVYVNGLTNIGDSKTYTHINPFNIYIVTWNTDITYNNYTFTIQLEKGSQATSYIVPKLVPVYKDNLTQQEKNEIGLGAFGGITKIIKTINDIIKPVGDFINGILSIF